MNTDLSVFTNKDKISLADRLSKILVNSKQFDVLVGYFRMTGFHLLYKDLEDISEIRILVGIALDKKTYDVFYMSTAKAIENFSRNIKQEFQESKDEIEIEEGVFKFLEWLESGKLKIRMCVDQNVHAKVYIIRKDSNKVPDQFGNLITGSSNFSLNGLENNIEFNVELKDKRDVEYGLNFFNDLWYTSVDISKDLVDIINHDTWLRSDISPYEMYLKTLYEYFIEDIGENDAINLELPPGFMKLEYQEQAVIQAYKILQKHGGVFIADVVGLGKTFVAAMLAKTLKGRKLFIVPPVVKHQWENVLEDFGFPRSDKVESHGKIDKIINWYDIDTYDYVFIDEAHRFRNDGSLRYNELKRLCRNKKVILITATPQNNNIFDLANLINLFQASKNSSIIPNCKDIDNYFKEHHSIIKKVKGAVDELVVIKEVMGQIREDVLKHVMIRRTRTEIQKYFKSDINEQGLKFPKLEAPERLTYVYNEKMEIAFNKSIELISKLKYARYTPLLYLKDKTKLGDKKSGQENLKGFIKSMLIKRLESSIYAFKISIGRIQKLNENFITIWREKKHVVTGAMSKGRKYDLEQLYILNDEVLFEMHEEEKINIFQSNEFIDNYEDYIINDTVIFNELKNIWKEFDDDKDDTKFDELVKKIKDIKDNNSKLIIFTEAKDTVVHLERKLKKVYPGEVISYTGSDNNSRKEYIKQNFDPNFRGEKINDKSILIATDAMSEGINLHRANKIINYDLPWNPTRVMQRSGRINRIGTKHDNLYTYNFFPAANTKGHLSLEDSIKTKIAMFHELLGEDSKFLTEEEIVEVHGLYNKLMSVNKMDEEDIDSGHGFELSLLQELRELKTKDKELFTKIKELPIKLRVGRDVNIKQKGLISFIKQGVIKDFYFTNGNETKSLDFATAIKLIKADKDEISYKVPSNFYELLKNNKKGFNSKLNDSEMMEIKSRSGKNEKKVKLIIKFLLSSNLEYRDREFVKSVQKSIENGELTKSIYKNIANKTKEINKLELFLSVIKKEIPLEYLGVRNNYKVVNSKEEDKIIVLSEYLI